MTETYNREKHCGFGNPVWDFEVIRDKEEHEKNELHQYCRRVETYEKQGYSRRKAMKLAKEEMFTNA